MKPKACLRILLCTLLLWFTTNPGWANLPGGGTGTGANVTLTDNGTTVTIANGIVSIVCTKSGASINQINYTYNNGGGTKTMQLLNGGTDGGELYWETGGFDATASGYFSDTAYTVVANPANTGGNYAEISMQSASPSNGVMEVHFSLLRGSSGFYVTPIWYHRSQDVAMGMGETRDNIYAGSIFNWMSVDAARSRLMEVSGGLAIGVLGAPVEVSLWTNGIYQGQYEDKYKYSADFGDQRVWGWSSVGTGGQNVGLWNVSGSMEYHVDGPLKRDLMEHIGTTVLNMMNSSHYGSGNNDGSWAAGEVWTKVYGPYFIYFNNVANTLTGTNAPAQALYSDALAQALAEQGIDTNGQPTGATGAWPYYWFTNAYYTPASGRGTITGQIAIADSANPNASAAGLWVGAIQQPSTTDGMHDFQEWMKAYQFWVKSGTNGSFTIPNVVPGNNYTLYAFGPGSPGMFQSQSQSGGNTPDTYNLPATPFSVVVTAGATNNLGTVTWTPTRSGPTVFEIGYPDRKGDKFRHGDDYWVSDIGPSPTAPSPIWSKHLEYPFEFPNGPNYVVGQSRWTTDWNYVQPVIVDGAGNLDNSSATITFNLPSAPAANATAAFYLALASDYSAAIIIQVNGTYITSSTGYYANFTDENDTTIRQGINGAFSDARTTFAGSLLHAGQNTITISIRQTGGTYFADHAMYDYLRLELSGYVPPAPARVTAYAGNNGNLVTWPVTPGATSYKVYESSPANGYVLLTNGVVGPVCGSGTNNATFLDTAAVNGTPYTYEVQSVNSAGTSASSPPSNAATPDPSLATIAPAAPTGLSVTATGSLATPALGQVTLNWTASPGANFYSIQRSTVVANGGGSNVVLGTILLNNTNTTTSYVDATPTCGSMYLYAVSATSAGGTSPASTAVLTRPVPPPPAAPPGGLTASFVSTTNVYLKWAPVTGAIGYLVQRSSPNTNTYFLLASVTETNYTDYGLSPTTTYYYKITPVNEGGTPTGAVVSLNGPPPAPGTLSAVPGYQSVVLNWPAVSGATSYVIRRGTTSGVNNYTVATGYAGTSYTNTSLVNGTTYYYVVASMGTYGTGTNSLQVSATPFNGATPNIVFTGATANGVVVTGTGGLAGINYYVLTTTNLTLPRANWTPVVTNYFDGAGGFNFTNGINPTNAQQFFQLEVP